MSLYVYTRIIVEAGIILQMLFVISFFMAIQTYNNAKKIETHYAKYHI